MELGIGLHGVKLAELMDFEVGELLYVMLLGRRGTFWPHCNCTTSTTSTLKMPSRTLLALLHPQCLTSTSLLAAQKRTLLDPSGDNRRSVAVT